MEHCRQPLRPERLVEYWLGELEASDAAAVEEHYFACVECSMRLQELSGLAAGIRAAFEQGLVHAFLTPEFVARLQERGLRVREYRVPRNGSVNCSVAPQDEVVLGRLQAPLQGVTRLDAIVATDGEHRLQDIPFDAAAGEVLMAPSIRRIRSLPACREVVRLVAVDATGERILGHYTFNHVPCN